MNNKNVEKRKYIKENKKYIKNRTRVKNYDLKTSLENNVVLEANNVWKIVANNEVRYDIVKGINLKIYKKDFVMIFGESGSGKTSLISILSGLERPSEGNVNINGNNTSPLSQSQLTSLRNKEIGYIFQQYGLLSDLTVLENVIITLDSDEQNRIIKLNKKFKKIEKQFIEKNQFYNYISNTTDMHHNGWIIESNYLLYGLFDCGIDYIFINDAILIRKQANIILEKMRDEHFANEYVYSILKHLEIAHLMDKKTLLLSGGQQQRVSISRAVAKKPNILFADEPTGAVDSYTAKLIMKLFVQINNDYDTTIIMVTHNSNLSLLAKRNIVISNGLIIEDQYNLNITNVDNINFE